jgi:peptidoglycan/LPS O-acetylase OafA/YrhL
MFMNSTDRQNNFNLIRLILALLVILGHSPELVDGNRNRELLTLIFGSVSFGELAVDGFFLLSGYLIMQSWDAQPHGWQFLKKRLLRIYPGFIFASSICAFAIGPQASNPSAYFAAFQSSAFLQSVLALNIPDVPAVFEGTHYASINGAMWTISREFACYIFVLVAGITGALRLRHFCLSLTIAVFVALIALKLAKQPVSDLRLVSFFLSGTCYYIYRDHFRLNGTVAVLCTAVVLVFMFSWRASELALASIGGYALIYVAKKRSTFLSDFNRLPDVSYGIYLYGWPIQKLLLWYFPSLTPWSLFAFSAPAAIFAGTVSWHLVEKPALRFKKVSARIQRHQQEAVNS